MRAFSPGCDLFALCCIFVDMTSRFSTQPDSFTLTRAQRGDARAQESIYRLYERAVFGLARRLSEQFADAEEITQDTFIQVFCNMGDFRNKAPFGFWVRAIAANQALLWRRKREVSRAISQHVDSAPFRFPVQMDLAHALAQLPQPTRGILWLYFVEGYTHAEIADLHQQSLSFSKSQVARGTERLRAAFQPDIPRWPSEAAS